MYGDQTARAAVGMWKDVLTQSVRNDGPDLSVRQWAILLTVYLTPGPHTVRGLSDQLRVPKPAISRALDTLSILKLVRRGRDDGDRRIVLVQRTPEGAEYVDAFSSLIAEVSGVDDEYGPDDDLPVSAYG
ncbi:MAG: MarR family winged helix-turn-helix transcriptional regulator [Pseudomonadota bacterium]